MLIGAGMGSGSPQPFAVLVTRHTRSTRDFESGAGRDELKYIVFPSGERRGGKSRYFPENGSTSGLLHFPSRQ